MHLVRAGPDELTHTKTMNVIGPDMALAREYQGKYLYVHCRQVKAGARELDNMRGGSVGRRQLER